MKLVVRLSFAILLLFAASGFAACSEDDPVQGGTSSRLVGDGSADSSVDRSDNDRNNMERDIRTTVNGTSFSATFGKM